MEYHCPLNFLGLKEAEKILHRLMQEKKSEIAAAKKAAMEAASAKEHNSSDEEEDELHEANTSDETSGSIDVEQIEKDALDSDNLDVEEGKICKTNWIEDKASAKSNPGVLAGLPKQQSSTLPLPASTQDDKVSTSRDAHDALAQEDRHYDLLSLIKNMHEELTTEIISEVSKIVVHQNQELFSAIKGIINIPRVRETIAVVDSASSSRAISSNQIYGTGALKEFAFPISDVDMLDSFFTKILETAGYMDAVSIGQHMCLLNFYYFFNSHIARHACRQAGSMFLSQHHTNNEYCC